MIKAVIVDFDDTICMTEEACFHLEAAVLKRIGAQPTTRDIHKRTWGKPLFEIIKVRSPGVDVDAFRKELAVAQLDWVRQGKIDNIPLPNLQALDALIANGKQVFILTSRTHQEVVHLMAPDHDLSKRIKMFYYRDVMLFHKPDPRAFDQLFLDHQLEPKECIYVGDALSDAEAAKGAGMHFIASLESGLKTKDDFAPYPVDNFIAHFTDLPVVIASIQ